MTDGWQRLADYVRSARAARGWTQRELANQAHVSLKTVTDVEAGRQRRRLPNTVPKIEAALGLDPGTARRIIYEGGAPPGYEQRPTLAAAEPPDRVREIIRLIRELDDADRGEGRPERRLLLDMLELELERRRPVDERRRHRSAEG